jgi:23S rRNA (cytidine1920-2'-O)/16S rRNA (cytidine1409-2'-O)-methyltransferase
MKKPRADQQLVNLGLAKSRTEAQALIMAGQVYHGTLRVEKPGTGVAADAVLTVKAALHPWVSRGGLKLAAGLAHFNLSPAGLIAADIGASTGGFTDVLLHHGAAKVYAVDVGSGQLAWKLQTDPRVIRMDGTNARHLTAAEIPEPPQAVVCDASFISLTLVLPAILALAAPGAWLIALIKPQFEVGKDNVGKGGIVRDETLHAAVCDKISTWLTNEMQWDVLGIAPSPITGAEGNKEFLIAAKKPI